MSAFGPKVEADGALALPCWIGGHAYLTMAPVFLDVMGRDGSALRRVPLCDADTVKAAVAAACAATAAWHGMDGAARDACFTELARLLEHFSEHLAGLVGEECGVSEESAAAELERALHAVRTSAATGGADTAGVVGVIGDVQAPLAGPIACTVAALRAGRAVVIKSSPKAPSALLAVCEVFARSGFPDGMVNVVHGDEAVVLAFSASDALEALAYVGGAGVGDKVRALAAGSGKPLIGGVAGDELLHAWRRQLGVAG